MLRLIVRVILTALLFSYVFPAVVPGVQFHGNFWPQAFIYAAAFSLVAWAVRWLIGLGALVFSVATLGIGALLVFLALIFGFWMIPAIQLQVFAYYFPEHFTVASWGSAIVAGLLLMVVNFLTQKSSASSSSSQ